MMRKLIILLIGFILLGPVTSQAGPVEKVMRKYARKDGVIQIRVPGIAKYVAIPFIEEDLPKKLVKKFKGVRVVTNSISEDKTTHVSLDEIGGQLLKALEKDNYVPLLEVLDNGDQVMIYIKKHKRKKHIKRVFIMVNDGDEFVLLRLKSKLNLKDLSVDELQQLAHSI
jgi:hypothetical protein